MTLLRTVHRCAGLVLGAYVLVHLVNHLTAVSSIGRHVALMDAVRRVTRIPLVEALLLAAAAVQVGSGLMLILRRRTPRRLVFDRLQAASGLYLAFFLLVHVSSVLAGRFALELDTNFYFAAAGLNIRPYYLFFAPYYFLAVAALFVHLACALRRFLPGRLALAQRERAASVLIAAGGLMALLIVATFSGAFYTVDLPAAYRATFP